VTGAVRAQPEPVCGGGEHGPGDAVRAQPEPVCGGGEHGPGDAVDVWLVDTSGAPSGELLALLDPAERRRYDGILRPADARRFAIAHGVTRRLVADRLGVADFRWVYGPNGKPSVADAEVQVNLSHSGDLAMVAFSAIRPVGVDLQQVLPGLDVAAMAARYFPPAEALVAGPDEFALLWARKEALVKAAGGRLTRGLAVPVAGPAPVLADHDGPYRITDVEAPPGFRAAVALAGTDPFTVRGHRFETAPR
jgi:4'-phosphopantetheinyl transferase